MSASKSRFKLTLMKVTSYDRDVPNCMYVCTDIKERGGITASAVLDRHHYATLDVSDMHQWTQIISHIKILEISFTSAANCSSLSLCGRIPEQLCTISSQR